MPQFDQFSFFNQVSFALFFFFNFYFFITYYFLPKIAFNIKFRKKFIIFKINKKNILNIEIKNKKLSYTDLLKDFSNYYELAINENIYNYNNYKNEYLLKNSLIKLIYIEKIRNLFSKKFIISKKYLLNI
uniref:ATP synthase F0 subunit 8 n=1 Tax=Aphanomyces astaci TaxID=112090 RepID=A0A1I9Q6D9_APHAT|nr:ATP synthase F0 subunit 8 [Aphanomyces astaci]AOQ30627.1 ATP synthase F0 subunit 8 [Aphanomyces astaci]